MTEFTPPNSGDHDSHSEDPFARLEAILERDTEVLEALTDSPEPLTVGRLEEIDPRLGALAEEVAATAILWPDDDTAVRPAEDAPINRIHGEDANFEFVHPILKQGTWAYNNFFLVLGTKHDTPSEAAVREYLQSDSMTKLAYGTRTYVDRAYSLVPEFMTALQEATASVGSMEDWNAAMLEGHLDADEHPEKAVLLKATRMAYVLLAKLMHREDKRIQTAMLRLPTRESDPITDPATELRT